MSVTSKPNDGEPIAHLVKDPIMGDKFIATPVYWRFFDELTQQTNQSANSGSQIDALAITNSARTALNEYKLEDNPFTVDTTGETVDATNITVDMAKA